MIKNCPSCQGALTFNAGQLEKIEQALKGLKPGQRLPLKCPHCKKPMGLDAAGEVEGAATSPPVASPKTVPSQKEKDAAAGTVKPPPPPNMDWLNEKEQMSMDDHHARDVPMALVLHNDETMREQTKAAMEALGYQVMSINIAEDAIEHVRSTRFACIILHVGFESGELKDSVFHNYMCNMPMSQRRYIFYILMGPQFTSLYDIEALAYSANLVIADKDFNNFQLILHKAIPYYEQLFGPLLEELSSYGKQ